MFSFEFCEISKNTFFNDSSFSKVASSHLATLLKTELLQGIFQGFCSLLLRNTLKCLLPLCVSETHKTVPSRYVKHFLLMFALSTVSDQQYYLKDGTLKEQCLDAAILLVTSSSYKN